MKKITVLFSVILTMIFLGACNEATSQSTIFEDVYQAMNELETLEVETTNRSMLEGNIENSSVTQYDFSNGTIISKTSEGIDLFFENDHIDIFIDGEVAYNQETSYYEDTIKAHQEKHNNKLKYLEQHVPDIEEKFEVIEEESTYILTFKGEQQDYVKLVSEERKEIYSFLSEITGYTYELLDVEKYILEITVDKETNLIEKTRTEAKFTESQDGEEQNNHYIIIDEYKEHNQVVFYDKPEAHEIESQESNQHTEQPLTISDEEKEQYELEAANYLEALIQATVYQDIDGYLEKAPDAETEEQKQSSAETQKEMFRLIYKQNLVNGFAGTDVELDEKQVDDLSFAFMNALSQTKYKVVDSEVISENTIVVTLEVTGFSDTKIIQQSAESSRTALQNDEITEEEFYVQLLDSLIESYNEEVLLEPPVQVPVQVQRESNGAYLVLLQDQYLMAFAQQ